MEVPHDDGLASSGGRQRCGSSHDLRNQLKQLKPIHAAQSAEPAEPPDSAYPGELREPVDPAQVPTALESDRRYTPQGSINGRDPLREESKDLLNA